MRKNIYVFALFCFLLQSCTASWFALQLETEGQPIQLGPHHLSVQVDSLGIITGKSTHEFEEETYSESKHSSISFGGSDDIREDINSTIYSALDDNPEHFIADGEYVIEVEHGISFSAVISGLIASWITDGEPEFGAYSSETIEFSGEVYKIRNTEDK